MYIRGIDLQEYQKEIAMQGSNLMINEEHDPEVTGEAYRIQRDLPKIPDFIIEDVEVNTNNIAKTTDTTVTLRLTISNV